MPVARLASTFPALLAAAAARADPATLVPSRTADPTPGQRTRDTLDPSHGLAKAAGRAADRVANPNRS
jgi:hypothetical protein